jgi:hypothetical protein
MITKLFFPVIVILICLLRLTGYVGYRGDDNYCAKLRDGKLVMMHDGEVMTADVTLQNGTQIKTDGSIIKQDGGTIVLKDGECVNKKGRVEDGHPKQKKNQ